MLALGLTLEELRGFFNSGNNVLCPWHDHLDLPDFVRECLPRDTPPVRPDLDFSSFDRLLIYTDGSSKASNRRKPPLWVQDYDIPDAWSFVVVGERYGDGDSAAERVFIGWHALSITYEHELSHHLSADNIGSEREALFWAALWRLSLNLNIPTVFTSGRHRLQQNCAQSLSTLTQLSHFELSVRMATVGNLLTSGNRCTANT